MPQLDSTTLIGTLASIGTTARASNAQRAPFIASRLRATAQACLLLAASLTVYPQAAYAQDADPQHPDFQVTEHQDSSALAPDTATNNDTALTEPESCQILYSAGSPALFDFVGTRGRVSFADYAGYTIGNIHYHVLPIFNENDPDENNWLFRSANWLHIDTKEKTIAKQMIIATGEPLEPLTLNENERILRANDYLIDAMILPQKICGRRLDLLVVVRDIWTFSPTASASRGGGDDSSGAGLSEKNLFGSGQRVSIGYFQDSERNGTTVSYRNPLLPHRLSLRLGASDTSDGESYLGSLTKPFYELNSTWSAGVSVAHESLAQTIERNDIVINKYQQTSDAAEVFFGWSAGRRNNVVNRWSVGITNATDVFERLPNDTTSLPADEQLTYPWVEWSYQQDKYKTEDNINRSHQQEDIQLGLSNSIRLGYANERFGSDSEAVVFSTYTGYARYLSRRNLVRSAISTNGQRDNNTVKNTFFSTAMDHFYFINDKNRWYTRVAFTGARNIRQDEQLSIGGNDNLRGYPNDYQRGNRRWVASIERRRFSNWHLFNLAYVGAAAYIDAGKVWDTETPNAANTDTLADLGFGIRLSPSKFRIEKVMHIDIAAPLVNRDEVDDYQLIVTGRVDF